MWNLLKSRSSDKGSVLNGKILIALFLFFFSFIQVYPQNITNILGEYGVFSIKHDAITFLSLNQCNGLMTLNYSLTLPNTTSSSTGVIYKGTDRFFHNFKGPNAFGYNIFIGLNSGNFTMNKISDPYRSSYNIGIGANTLLSNREGCCNTAVGHESLRSNIDGENNVAIGFESLYNSEDGCNIVAIGYHALYYETDGSQNTAVGSYAMFGVSQSTWGNTAIGGATLYSPNLTGNYNTAVGQMSLNLNSTGSYNTGLGSSAGSNLTSGSNVTCLGYNSQPSSTSVSNEITLGNGSVGFLRCNTLTITSLSDMRDKKNIKDLSLGIDFLMKLKPRLYNWDKREWYEDNKSDGSKMQETPTAGFIAQELDEVQTSENAEWLNLVLKNNPDKLEATPGNLLPIVVKAIQDLKTENDDLKIRLIALEQKSGNTNAQVVGFMPGNINSGFWYMLVLSLVAIISFSIKKYTKR